MRKTEPDKGLAAWLAVLQLRSAVVEALEDDLEREHGTPLAFFEVLLQLTSAPEGRLKMQELAESVLISKSGITRLVDRMESAGLVERQACASDRRAIHAVATPAGRARLRNAIPTHVASLEQHFSRHLTAAELESLRAIMRKVLNANGVGDTPCPSLASASG